MTHNQVVAGSSQARVNTRVNFKGTGANPTQTYVIIKTNVFFEKFNGNYVEITE